MGTLATTVRARTGVIHGGAAVVTGAGDNRQIRIGLNRGLDFRVDLQATLDMGDPFADQPEPSESAEAGIVQAVLAVKREFTFSDGTTYELRPMVGLPARDGDGTDREFATRPSFNNEVASKFQDFETNGTVKVKDFPSSTLWYHLHKYTGDPRDGAVLQRYVQRDAFRTGIMARWKDGSQSYYDWVDWETDIEAVIRPGVVPNVMFMKGDVNVTAHGMGEMPYGMPGIFIAVREALKPRAGVQIRPAAVVPASRCWC